MGILKHGPFGMTTGKIQNMVSYDLNGKNVIRRIGRTKKKPTVKQLAVRQKMAVVIKFLKVVEPVINVGFKALAVAARKSAHNMATSYNTKNATTGEYPEIVMDYSKAMIAEGDLMQPLDPQVELLTGKLRFTWQNQPDLEYTNRKDQIMMLAYFPDSHEASIDIYGAQRTVCEDFLLFDNKRQNTRMEVYIAFVSSDRESTSDTIYLGAING
jgi:hypothetical protein